MSSAVLREETALAILRAELASTYDEGPRALVRRGIGDDAAVIQGQGSKHVVSTDACNEGSHFLRSWMRAGDVAHKSFHAALSDVPAMGAAPAYALCHLTLPPWVTSAWLRSFARHQAAQASSTHTALVGGNVSFGDHLQVVTTVWGKLDGRALQRDGARPGDEVWLLGDLGLARAGLLLLQAGILKGRNRAESKCLQAFRRPHARVLAGPALKNAARSCMDVSDGLKKDALTLARASGVRLVLERDSLLACLRPELTRVAQVVAEPALSLAYLGGEDYALLATGPRSRRPEAAAVIGRVERGKGAELR